MHFELLITGKLPNGKGNKNLGHRTKLRMQVHEQLHQLWQIKPLIDRHDLIAKAGGTHLSTKHGKDFITLGSTLGHTACRLDIVMYEPDGGMEVTSHVADADNRLAGLLDLLTVPVGTKAASELPSQVYTLLEDDKLVWSLSIERRRLLRPIEGQEMFTRIGVRIIPTYANMNNLALIDISAH